MPMRLGDLADRLKSHGVKLERPSSGSHWKFVGPGGRTYPVPAHNGLRTELPDVYVRGAHRAFGIAYSKGEKKKSRRDSHESSQVTTAAQQPAGKPPRDAALSLEASSTDDSDPDRQP